MSGYRGRGFPFVDGYWARVSITESGCWEWLGAKDPKGYGRWGSPSLVRTQLAHRIMYLFAVGPIEDGQVVMHSCDNPGCVRPSHLSVGSVADNQADMASKGRGYWKSRDRCVNGHLFAEHGRVVLKRKSGLSEHYSIRLCLACKADEQRRRRADRRR